MPISTYFTLTDDTKFLFSFAYDGTTMYNIYGTVGDVYSNNIGKIGTDSVLTPWITAQQLTESLPDYATNPPSKNEIIQKIAFDSVGFSKTDTGGNYGYLYVLTDGHIFRINKDGVSELLITIDINKYTCFSLYIDAYDYLYYATQTIDTTTSTGRDVYAFRVGTSLVKDPTTNKFPDPKRIVINLSYDPSCIIDDSKLNIYISNSSSSNIQKFGLASVNGVDTVVTTDNFLPLKDVDGNNIKSYKSLAKNLITKQIYASFISSTDEQYIYEYNEDGTYNKTITKLNNDSSVIYSFYNNTMYYSDDAHKTIKSYVPDVTTPIPTPIPTPDPTPNPTPNPTIIPTIVPTVIPTPKITPYNTMISNICFPGFTPITTDQGIIAIDKIDPSFHTIDNKEIVRITRTVTLDKYLVCFEKDAFCPNYPSERTIMTAEHKIFCKGQLVKAKKFLGKYPGVKLVKYSGQPLYNILMKTHETVTVNNLTCETLSPTNLISLLYTMEIEEPKKNKIFYLLNESIFKRDCKTYTQLISILLKTLNKNKRIESPKIQNRKKLRSKVRMLRKMFIL